MIITICSNVTLSVGLLSYTFLRKTVKDDIVVPMVMSCWISSVLACSFLSCADIFYHYYSSIFKTKMATSYLWCMVHRVIGTVA
jgi:hypothetical protein